MPTNKQSKTEAAYTRAWQQRAFPLMVGVIIFFSVFFISATAYQLLRIQDKIDYKENNAPTFLFENVLDKNANLTSEQQELLVKKNLETYVIDRRYHQGNMLLTSRIWIQYLGFLVGTILVLIGAIFIVGKMQETNSNFDSDVKNLGKLSFNSSSPGLFLAFFGTIIIASTLFYHPEISTEDASLFMDRKYEFDVKEGGKKTTDYIERLVKEGIDEKKQGAKKTKFPKIEKK
ncbi:hypothetical protein [Eudoraea sp.]|uniref:hypothetical protein n=1 Tax=Eudoraea sp. TaxID=1979955 RepID=UPI003C71841B